MRCKRLQLAFASVAILALTQATNGGKPPAPAPFLMPPAIHQALIKSDGLLTADLRAAYLDWAEKHVLDELVTRGHKVDPDCLNDVDADSTLRDAMFAAVYPPDADVLQNYDRLRSALGADFARRYRSLLIGVAMAHRSSLVAPATEADFYPAGASTEPSEPDDAAEPSDALSRAVAEFLKTKNLTALEVYQDPDKRQQLIDDLRQRHIERKQVDPLKNNKPMGRALKRAMIILGQRPAAREAKPGEIAWLKYLASIYETKPASTPQHKKGKFISWPLFPMDRAPWPLLMPMARAMPLGEARYIWDKFTDPQAKDRFHTYGPYRLYDKEILYELQPSDLHWESWQDRCIHGGVCVVMCTITIDLYSSLCVPSVHAGQPHHANLISYHNVDGQWQASIDQAFAGGPPVTHAAWLFHDEPMLRMTQKQCGAEYHMGLAQAMNAGLRTYIDTRIAVNLYNALPLSEQKTVGLKLLTQATHENPFNPAPWYLLASQTTNAAEGLALAQASHQHDGDPDEKKADPVVRYWRTITQFITREAVLRHPMPKDEAQARRIYLFLKSGVPGVTAEDQAPYAKRFDTKTADAARYRLLRGNFSHPDIAEADRVAVILQHDRPFGRMLDGVGREIVVRRRAITDMIFAANILKGNKFEIETHVVPGGTEVHADMMKLNLRGVEKGPNEQSIADILVDAGCRLGPSRCAACLGGPSDTFGRLNDALTCISTTNRNFPGRMESTKSAVYLASPLTVAASALTGFVTDPREYVSKPIETGMAGVL